jgi:hypothetical protein
MLEFLNKSAPGNISSAETHKDVPFETILWGQSGFNVHLAFRDLGLSFKSNTIRVSAAIFFCEGDGWQKWSGIWPTCRRETLAPSNSTIDPTTIKAK